jgi:preprotein translocase subunit SecA
MGLLDTSCSSVYMAASHTVKYVSISLFGVNGLHVGVVVDPQHSDHAQSRENGRAYKKGDVYGEQNKLRMDYLDLSRILFN